MLYRFYIRCTSNLLVDFKDFNCRTGLRVIDDVECVSFGSVTES